MSTFNEGLGDAVEYAAGNLPDGWSIDLCVEKGSAWVRLADPDGEGRQFGVSEATLPQKVRYATNLAQCVTLRRQFWRRGVLS